MSTRRKSDESDRVRDLSPRERAVARLVMDGLPLKCIGSELGISVYTAATYLSRARQKLGQPSRWKLAVNLWRPLPSCAELLNACGVRSFDCSVIRIGDSLLAGCSNKEIATRNGTTPAIVAREVARILKALEVRTRADLISLAAQYAGRHCSKNSCYTIGAGQKSRVMSRCK